MSMLSQFISIRLLVLVLLLLHLAIAQRRGGSHSGGSDSDDGDDDGDNGGSGDDDGSGGGSSGGGDSALPSSPCDWGARHKAFGLPGIYYNGTLTIRHHITANTAWDKEVRDSPAPPDEFTNCQNDDRSAKTYDYPAILLVAPTGNDSDTNPFHWQLRAFQPANQVRGDNGVDFLDFEQRWVYIRSSDFVATNGTVSDYSERWPVRNKWRDADATQLNQVTRVYWPTKITSEDGGVYSSSAEYSHEPPSVNKADYNLPVRSYGKHTSQYVTLSDVCSFHQETEGIFGDAAALPRSEITTGDTNIATTTPTLWLATGATAEMAGIGGNSVQMTLNNSLERVAPLSGDRKAGFSCGAYTSTKTMNFQN
ncbi:uncharacterized protein DNG_09433 [Cephalotrichum gorgonifer]|uniref:Uncharacterized protein n=1 Tax=Cephalotrichum gorgonifer TaxID=2041049 RepID=A0AAE8N7A1_9PEZI|nr:uncharacterized protein DNG_09433 [Cephalotrichum gorgonifer]